MIPFWVFETAAATGLIVASFRAFCDQRRNVEAKELELQKAIENHASEKKMLMMAHAEEKGRLESIIESLRPPTAPTFEIEGVTSDILPGPKSLCQIRIHNKNPIRADNVQVEVTAFEDAMENETQAALYHPKSSVVLKPEIAGASSINPGQKLTFNLFSVAMVDGSAKSEEAVGMVGSRYGTVTVVDDTRQQDIKNEMVPYRVFVAYFTQDIGKNLARFFWKKPYPIKISISSHIGELEQEFNLSFADAGKTCRFTLTKINHKSRNQTLDNPKQLG